MQHGTMTSRSLPSAFAAGKRRYFRLAIPDFTPFEWGNCAAKHRCRWYQGPSTGSHRQGAIDREKVHFVAPPRDGLDTQLARCLDWLDEPPVPIDNLIRAGIGHLWLVTLHPFEDSNGRLARALSDMLLCRGEGQRMRLFSLSDQILRQRNEHYSILERTQRGGLDVTEWLAWFLE
jgi:Fic family protein